MFYVPQASELVSCFSHDGGPLQLPFTVIYVNRHSLPVNPGDGHLQLTVKWPCRKIEVQYCTSNIKFTSGCFMSHKRRNWFHVFHWLNPGDGHLQLSVKSFCTCLRMKIHIELSKLCFMAW